MGASLYDIEKEKHCTDYKSKPGYWFPADVTLILNAPPWPR
jgi:hypothetical protein